MSGYYMHTDTGFSFWPAGERPRWRDGQIGALGALLSHWSVHPAEPALLSLPTGSGKSAVAVALPHLVGARRVLVVVPSRALREQLVLSYGSQGVLREIGALTGQGNPVVLEVQGRVDDWDAVEAADVVVALPQSISPGLYDPSPPSDMFDVIVMDEAHHAPATSWRAILDHYAQARRVLLTATPKRRDGNRVPGDPVFHYPLAKAIADGVYKPVRAALVDVKSPVDPDECDRAIRDEVLGVLSDPQHESSTLLIRASTEARARSLAQLYSDAGRATVALTNRLSSKAQSEVLAGLRHGSIRSVAVVSMLGEGFDLPSIRVVAYHDKHRSMPATTQLIGRLVRHSPEHPQESVLVTARDIDVFPTLQGAVRELYEEDADWEILLPNLLDREAEVMRREQAFVAALETAPNELSTAALRVPVRATVYETHTLGWAPDFAAALHELEPGARLVGGTEVFYSTLTPQARTMVVVTRGLDSPRWHAHPGLDSHRFDLHLITWVPPRVRDQPGLVLLNSSDANMRRLVLELLGTDMASMRGANPQRLHGSFDALTRLSVSNVGVRSTNVGARRGSASYKMFAGSGVDRGLREVDTAAGAIGHAMAQVSTGEGRPAYNAGIAVEKAKMWESRYVTLMQYDEVMASFAARYYTSAVSANPLLPDVSRGSAVDEFPMEHVAFIEWNPEILGRDWVYNGDPLEYLDLRVSSGRSTRTTLALELRQHPEDPTPLWRGEQGLDGEVTSTGRDLAVHRGYHTTSIALLLTESPATIRFLSGQSVVGRVSYERPRFSTDLTRIAHDELDWSGVNLLKETDPSAAAADAGISVQARVRAHLIGRAAQLSHRWILDNDGKGEMADLIVLETDGQAQARLELWHVKPSGGSASNVRVTDIEVLGAQAAKSRRWFVDPEVFAEMRSRYILGKAPRMTLVEGDDALLREMLTEASESRPWTLLSARPIVRGAVVIVQPGLSWSSLTSKLEKNDLASQQTRDLLNVVNDALGSLAETRVVCAE